MMVVIAMLAVALTPLALVVRERRLARRAAISALLAEQDARFLAERLAVLRLEEVQAATRRASDGPAAGVLDHGEVADELGRLRRENDELRRRIGQLEGRAEGTSPE